MSIIQLEPVKRSQEAILQNLFQLYVHDFSEYWAGTVKGDLNAEGRFSDYPLEPYWEADRYSALLLRADGVIAGFALVNDLCHSEGSVDANVAEFFIARKYRRSGIGRQFAHALFERRPGVWEVAIARKNVAALNFWRNAIASCALTGPIAALDVASSEWDGPVLRFAVR